jgi:hypothetical protein
MTVDLWDDAIDETSKMACLKLGFGVKVFKLINFKQPKHVENNYLKASENYINEVLRDEPNPDKMAEYQVRMLKVKPLYWDKPENDIYCGNIVSTDISEKVWRRLVKVSFLFI